MTKLLVEQVDECLRKGSGPLAQLIKVDSRGQLTLGLALDEPMDKLLAAMLKCIGDQDEAIRLIAAAVESS